MKKRNFVFVMVLLTLALSLTFSMTGEASTPKPRQPAPRLETDPMDLLGGMWELVAGEGEGGDAWTAADVGISSTMTFDAGLSMADFWMSADGHDESHVGMKVKIIYGEGLYADYPNRDWHFEMETDKPDTRFRGSVFDGVLTIFKYTIYQEQDFAIVDTLFYEKTSDEAAMG